MILLLATKYPKQIAYCLFLLFTAGMAPVYGSSVRSDYPGIHLKESFQREPRFNGPLFVDPAEADRLIKQNVNRNPEVPDQAAAFIDGPSQPEMSSFKSAGVNNMVDLFSGDFSYNIPLMDVGGYPVNIFYSGGITPEQEASWVGLGWNINPGNINRNMRGIPDDFNGQDDTLVEYQAMKPNRTWGVRGGAAVEWMGKHVLGGSLGLDLGISFNNYLGPAAELGLKGGLNVMLAPKAAYEKAATDTFASTKIRVGASISGSSRYGLTVAPNASFSSQFFSKNRGLSGSLGLSTSYNSRTGISDLQLNSQASYNRYTVKENGKSGTGKYGITMLGSSISFSRPSYIPNLRTVTTNNAFAGHGQVGFGLWGGAATAELEIYFQQSEIQPNDRVQRKLMAGYLHYEKAKNNANVVMDFTRFNDREVTPQTPIVSAPQYAYDVFSIQAEGTGGSIRAYRSDIGYVRDNFTATRDANKGFGVDIAPPGHFGGNFNTINTPTTVGEWQLGNGLKTLPGFGTNNEDKEAVYFRSPGEASVIDPDLYTKLGGTDLVRFKLGASNSSPSIQPVLQRFNAEGSLTGEVSLSGASASQRAKRTQVFSFLTAEEANIAGLDRRIKTFDPVTRLDVNNLLKFQSFRRDSLHRKKHHLSQVTVTEQDGKRYVYGIPVYNLVQKDFSFTVDQGYSPDLQLVPATANNASIASTHLAKDAKQDGFVQVTQTPAYAHSFLLSGLLSPDYVDITGDGITEDDMGTAVKFNYTQWSDHKWRTPLTSQSRANFNPGNLTETKDDKGIISYGERESWYLHSIESKSMIAFFTVEDREDGKGTIDSLQGVNGGDNSVKRLKQIDLYNKADLKKNGVAGARPIKTVHFEYNYSLATGTPDNAVGGGKLTLQSIYFTFNGQNRVSKNKYMFDYGGTATEKPAYGNLNNSDRWGTYKPYTENPDDMLNRDYPYTIQDKAKHDQYASAWSLRKILLPSGGQIEVEYEGDDYAYVQNRRAAQMMKVVGFGTSSASYNAALYDVVKENADFKFNERDYVFIRVPEGCSDSAEVRKKYLVGLEQLAFRLAVKMPKGGIEYIPSYAYWENYGVSSNDPTIIWVKLKPMAGLSPLSLSAVEYLREHLPGQAFKGYDLSDGDILDAAAALMQILGEIGSQLKDPVTQLRMKSKAREVNLERCFVRLNNPSGFKYGGGHRVKRVKLKDNWKKMAGQVDQAKRYNSEYGQEYDYTTTEVRNGVTVRISSGVASYEPTMGGDENPFQNIVQVADKLPLGPTTYGAVEMPVLDAFFPAAQVGYSKVTVRSIQKNLEGKKSRSGVGKQVTEFYTAKDFPVYYSHTSLDPASDKQDHKASLTAFLYKYSFDSRAISQGFLVAVNDMHGKMRSQSSYAENDTSTRINYTENFYRNTGKKGLEEKFDFIHQSKGGEVLPGNMGIDIELMTDTRQFSVKSNSLEIQAQADLFPVVLPFWIPTVWGVAGNTENTYRAVTTTKVINYHAVLDSVVVIDKGSVVSTKNLVFDAETGSVVINRTNNEFDKPIYSVNYPAYWAYSGMGLAYKNIEAVFSGINFLDGRVVGGTVSPSLLESGDELLITNTGSVPSDCGGKLVSGDSVRKLWVFDIVRNNQPLTSNTHDFIFIDEKGRPYTRNNVSFRIIRSGKRNMLNASAGAVTLMGNPLVNVGGKQMLVISNTSRVINSTAGDFKEKWQTDNDIIRTLRQEYDPATCSYYEVDDCAGYLEKSINPYVKGLLGNFRNFRNYVLYDKREQNIDFGSTYKLPQGGSIEGFEPYWTFDANNNLVPPASVMPPAIAKWIENVRTTRFNSKGMELETKDAMGIYTSAQYGYSKTTPTAIANNARYDEIANDNFEDDNYSDKISGENSNICSKDHASFRKMPNSQVVDAVAAGLNAHTGKYVLAVNANSTASQTFSVINLPLDTFNVNGYKEDKTLELFELGGNFEYMTHTPANIWQTEDPVYTVGGVGAVLQVMTMPADAFSNVTANSFTRSHTYYMRFHTYVDIPVNGNYTFTFTKAGDALNAEESNYLQVSIFDLDGNMLHDNSIGNSSPSNTITFFLCKGIYKLRYNLENDLTEVDDNPPPYQRRWREQFFVTTNIAAGYKSLNKQNGCTYTVPFPAVDSMFNPVFAAPAGKKMLFSTWVKQSCGTPCNLTNYENNKVEILFNSGSPALIELYATGPIIEGWQRYEASFIVPAGATTMTTKFINTGNQPVYFDDVRIHPFNANMKSYVYDPVSLRLVAELDANNYASFYEYDPEGTLIRTKAETKEGIKTITESRSAKQKEITTIQE